MIFLFQLPCGRWWTPQACGILHAVEPLKLFSSISLQTQSISPMELKNGGNKLYKSMCSLIMLRACSFTIVEDGTICADFSICGHNSFFYYMLQIFVFANMLADSIFPIFHLIMIILFMLLFFFSWSSYKFSFTSLLAWLDIFGL